MTLEKPKNRIAKKVKRVFQGHTEITLAPYRIYSSKAQQNNSGQLTLSCLLTIHNMTAR